MLVIMQNYVVFCDFDGTITKKDTVDELLNTFADKKWLDIEEDWQKGKIGSKECLIEQFKQIDRISPEQFNEFIKISEIDPVFPDFLSEINRKNIDFYIISDGFGFLINRIFKKYNISGCKIFSNKLDYQDKKFTPVFPLHNARCEVKSGLCKCSIVKTFSKDKKSIYIGDGKSDICASSKADILFAKNNLAEHCDKNEIAYFPYNDFNDIREILFKKELINAETGTIV